jgi:hypothetical protein
MKPAPRCEVCTVPEIPEQPLELVNTKVHGPLKCCPGCALYVHAKGYALAA